MVSDFSSFYFCSFLGSLFDHCLTNVWTTFGCLFGCLLGAFSGLLRFSWKPLDPKTLKNCRFFKVFEHAAFWLFEAPDGSLGSSLPIFARSGKHPLVQIGLQNWTVTSFKIELANFAKKHKKKGQSWLLFWSIFGNNFGAHFGTRSAKEGAR